MNSACENPRLRGRPEGLCDGDPTDVDAEIGKVSEELLPLCIITDHTHRKWFGAKRPKIVDGIGAASRNDLSFPMIQNEDRCFARNSRNFPVDEYVGDEIPNHHNALAFESIDNVPKPVHTNTPETIDSTAVSKLSDEMRLLRAVFVCLMF